MIRALKHLLGLAAREDATAAELTPSLPTAEAELIAAQVAQATAETSYRTALLTADEAALLKLDAARREATVRIDRATALIEALRERLADAQAREAEADRVMRFEKARQQTDDAAAALAQWYPQLASDLVALLMAVAQAEQTVQAANADLPRNAVPILPVEHRARSRDGSPEEVTDRVRVKRWVHAGQVLPGSVDHNAVVPTEGGRGRLKIDGLPLNEGRDMELRLFTEEAYFPADQGAAPDPLAQRLVLPGFRYGDADFFQPVERSWQGMVHPEEVLSRIAKLRAQPPAGAPLQAIQKRLIPENSSPVLPVPKPDDYREYKGRYLADEHV